MGFSNVVGSRCLGGKSGWRRARAASRLLMFGVLCRWCRTRWARLKTFARTCQLSEWLFRDATSCSTLTRLSSDKVSATFVLVPVLGIPLIVSITVIRK